MVVHVGSRARRLLVKLGVRFVVDRDKCQVESFGCTTWDESLDCLTIGRPNSRMSMFTKHDRSMSLVRLLPCNRHGSQHSFSQRGMPQSSMSITLTLQTPDV